MTKCYRDALRGMTEPGPEPGGAEREDPGEGGGAGRRGGGAGLSLSRQRSIRKVAAWDVTGAPAPRPVFRGRTPRYRALLFLSVAL